MSTHAHLDFPRAEPDHAGMDDMGAWSESHQPRPLTAHRAPPLPASWPTRRAFVPQGCDQQGRLKPSIPAAEPFPVVPDRLPEAYDDQGESADGDVLLWLLKGACVVSFVLFCAWVIAGGPNA